MNKESKLNLNAGDYAISHCDSDKTYNGLEVHKMLCDAYIAGNNDTLDDDKDEKIKNSLINLIKMSNEVGGLALHKWEADEMLAWIERQGEHANFRNKIQVGDKVTRNEDGYLVNLSQLKRVAKPSEKQGEQEKDILEDAILDGNEDGLIAETIRFKNEKQGEQKPQGKTALEAIKEEKADNQNCVKSVDKVEPKGYDSIDPHFWKPIDKQEPKFHEGEWITNGDYIWIIVGVKPLDYVLQSQDGNIVDDTISHVDEQFHSFTVADAKNGDVLVCNGNIKNSNGIKYERICLFNNLDNAFFTLTKTSNFVEEYNIDVNIDYPDNTVPATKEQKEILFMAMKDAGYEFDFEKKELKIVDWSKHIKCNPNPPSITKESAWSEEDSFRTETLIWVIKSGGSIRPELRNEFVNWLQSLKDRVQPKQEWSEEDEEILRTILSDGIRGAELDMLQVNWLKSLRPQNRWKPSSEQIGLLQAIINEPNNASSESCQIVLKDILEQLKKLKEE